MRLPGFFACVVMLLLLDSPSHRAAAQNNPSMQDTMDWIVHHLENFQHTNVGTPHGVDRYTSVTFPDEAAAENRTKKGCLLLTAMETRIPGVQDSLTVQTKIDLSLLAWPVTTAENDAGAYNVEFAQAAGTGQPDRHAIWQTDIFTHQWKPYPVWDLEVAETQQSADQMAHQFNRLIQLCGGKQQAAPPAS